MPPAKGSRLRVDWGLAMGGATIPCGPDTGLNAMGFCSCSARSTALHYPAPAKGSAPPLSADTPR